MFSRVKSAIQSSVVKITLRIIISLLLLGILLRYVDFGSLWIIVRSANIFLLSLAIALFFVGQILAAYKWFFLLKRLRIELPFLSVIRFNIIGQISGLMLPGRVSGDFVRVISASHGHKEKTSFVFSVVLDKLAFFFGLITFILLGIFGSGTIAHLYPIFILASFAAILTIIIIVFFSRFRSERLHNFIIKGIERFPVTKKYLQPFSQIQNIPKISYSSILFLILLGIVTQLNNFIGSYLSAQALKININPLDWASINAIVAFVQIFPVSIAGLGLREGVYANLLSSYQIPLENSISFSLLNFLIVSILVIFIWIVLEYLVINKT